MPPPVLFVGGWLAGWALNQLGTFEVDGAGPSSVQSAAGLVLLSAGLALIAWAMVTFRSANTPVMPFRPARLVVRTGPFRYTRNPIYLGMTSAYLGLSLVANQAWPVVLLPIVLVALTRLVIEHEERHLIEAFGTEYEAYQSHVRRWL